MNLLCKIAFCNHPFKWTFEYKNQVNIGANFAFLLGCLDFITTVYKLSLVPVMQWAPILHFKALQGLRTPCGLTNRYKKLHFKWKNQVKLGANFGKILDYL
jgi:hypothetical protein